MRRSVILAAALLLSVLSLSGCRSSMVTVSIPPGPSGVNLVPTVLQTLPEAGRLPIPLTDSLGVFRYRVPPGAIVSPPETVFVFQDLRAPIERAFPLLEATVDSADVTIFGAGMDCHFKAPAYGEKLTIVVDNSSCEGFVTGHPVAREVQIPRAEVEEPRGFFGKVGDLLDKLMFLVFIVAGAAVVIAVVRLLRR